MKFGHHLLIFSIGILLSLNAYPNPSKIRYIKSEIRWEKRRLNTCKNNTCYYQTKRCNYGYLPGMKKRCKKWYNIFSIGVDKCLLKVCGESEQECFNDCQENYNNKVAGLKARLKELKRGNREEEERRRRRREERRRRRREEERRARPSPRPRPKPAPTPEPADYAPCVDDCTFALFQCRKVAGRNKQERRDCKHKNITCKISCGS